MKGYGDLRSIMLAKIACDTVLVAGVGDVQWVRLLRMRFAGIQI